MFDVIYGQNKNMDTQPLTKFFGLVLPLIGWKCLTLPLPRTRTREILFGRARYCRSQFNEEITYNNALKNHYLIKNIVTERLHLAIVNTNFAEGMALLLRAARLVEPGIDLLPEKVEGMSATEKLKIAERCWPDMEYKLKVFLSTEPSEMTKGAVCHFQSLKEGRYDYEDKNLFPLCLYQNRAKSPVL